MLTVILFLLSEFLPEFCKEEVVADIFFIFSAVENVCSEV